MTDTLDLKEFTAYLTDLTHLKGISAFKRVMAGNALAIEFLNDSLGSMEPTDTVGIARLQGEVLHRKKFQREYDDCEKLTFELANRNKTDITKDNESGIVPPRR